MSIGVAAHGLGTWSSALTIAVRSVLILLGIAVVIQALVVIEARPQDLITGIHGMADLIWRAVAPDFSKLPSAVWPTLQTVDIALFGTVVGIVIAVPLAHLAAANMTPLCLRRRD
jgi:phosphonate transport system permease protein